MSVNVSDLDDLCRDVFGARDKRDPSPPHTIDTELWRLLSELGLTSVGLPEAMGGSGGTLAESAAIVASAACHAAVVPVAEVSWLAGWLLASHAMPLPQGVGTLGAQRLHAVEAEAGWRLHGRLRRVAFGHDAEWIAGVAETPAGLSVFLTGTDGLETARGTNLAGEPRDDVSVDVVVPKSAVVLTNSLTEAELFHRAALVRALMTTAVIQAATAMTIEYAETREQFGRPIGRFQAVQHEVARMAAEAAMAEAVTNAALAAYGAKGFTEHTRMLIAAAKVRTAEAGGAVATIAHQIHGAIGMTFEHPLHKFTSRIWSWRDEWGNDTTWAAELGSAAQSAAGRNLWAWLEGSA